MKIDRPIKKVSVSVLEARMSRAIRPKERLWATIRLAEELVGYTAVQAERALLLFTEAQQLAERIGNQRGVAAAIHGTGYCQLRFSNFPAAVEAFERALPIAEQTGYAECEIIILRDMGQVYERQGRQDLALETLQKCAELAELIGNTRVQASALTQIGTVFKNLGRYDESLEYHMKSLALFERTGIPREQAIPLANMSNTLRLLGRYAEALSALRQSSKLFHAGQDSQEYSQMEAIFQGMIGLIYSEIGDYPNALSSLLASAKISERIGDKLNLANSHGNLMQVYLQLGNTERAAEFGEKALAVFEEIGYQRNEAATLVKLGEYYIEREQKIRARQMLKRCLTLSREIGSKDYETVTLTLLAKLETDLGKFATAEKLLQHALAIASTSGDRDRTIAALLGLGRLFKKWDKPDYALSFLNQAITLTGEIHSRRHEQEAHQLLAEACEAEGDLKHALQHSKLASSIKEEILGTEKQKAIIELQIRSDIEKSEQEKALLKKETGSQSREIERMAMKLAEKTERIRSIRRRIRGLIKSGNGDKRSTFDELLSDLDDGSSTLEKKKKPIFNNEYQLVHRDLLQKLTKRYPTLTITERKICALLRDEFSIKEMASMMRISPDTIRTHRRQIRKKMKLAPQARLTTILAGI